MISAVAEPIDVALIGGIVGGIVGLFLIVGAIALIAKRSSSRKNVNAQTSGSNRSPAPLSSDYGQFNVQTPPTYDDVDQVRR